VRFFAEVTLSGARFFAEFILSGDQILRYAQDDRTEGQPAAQKGQRDSLRRRVTGQSLRLGMTSMGKMRLVNNVVAQFIGPLPLSLRAQHSVQHSTN
jgi:hypothetical protein